MIGRARREFHVALQGAVGATCQPVEIMVDDESGTPDATWLRAPEGWTCPTPEGVAHAKDVVLRALASSGENSAARRLARYYDTSEDCAGATFATLWPPEPFDVTATDLLATTLLGPAWSPGSVRRLLDDGGARGWILTSLRALPVEDLLTAGPDTLLAMDELHTSIETAIATEEGRRSVAEVAASTLCARKRPHLFPTPDEAVRARLGLRRSGEGPIRHVDWQVYRALIGDPAIITAIDTVENAVRRIGEPRTIHLDTSRLRLLDAVLRTYLGSLP